MSVFWLVLSLAAAGANWFAVRRNNKLRAYITKPAVILVLIVWTITASGWRGDMLWFGFALVFSLAGDILLMLPPRWFVGGLLGFLCAHICYLVGFNSSANPIPQDTFLYFAPVGLISFFIGKRINQALPPASLGKLRYLILIYSVVVGLMFYSALNTLLRPDWQNTAALMASAGAASFLVSDVLLAYDRFIQPLQNARLIVRITYHLGQITLAAAALAHFNFL